MSKEKIRSAVRERYGELAKTPTQKQKSCCSGTPDCCVGATKEQALRAKGYKSEDISMLPDDAGAIGAGCGNPTALASLQPGDVVLDLGSGGGFDVFIASKKVGEEGRVIGVDATPEMVWRSRRTADEEGYKNVEFRLGEIEHLPVESNSIDVVISNCVINLSPDKDQVFKEAFRVLKPRGRVAISDIVTLGDLPEEVKENLTGWAECVSGAISEDEYLGKLESAGFIDVRVVNSRKIPEGMIEELLAEYSVPKDVELYLSEGFDGIASDDIVAVKP